MVKPQISKSLKPYPKKPTTLLESQAMETGGRWRQNSKKHQIGKNQMFDLKVKRPISTKLKTSRTN